MRISSDHLKKWAVRLARKVIPCEETVAWRSEDLAPGDVRSRELDCREFDIARIHSSQDPSFGMAYERLWAEFGPQHEMESREILVRRLGWHPAKATGDAWLRYELLLVRRRGQFVAVRDHTAVVTRLGATPGAVVHLSHVLVDPAWRRTGLAGWLRAWPIQTARSCLAAAGLPANSPISLVAEMEHPDPSFPTRMIRLKAYEKAGFLKVDPALVNYCQPDFRPPADIDASGGPQPLPFSLLLRRVGLEHEQTVPGLEVRAIVDCLYQMYGEGFRASDMAAATLAFGYPGDDARVPLVPPTR